MKDKFGELAPALGVLSEPPPYGQCHDLGCDDVPTNDQMIGREATVAKFDFYAQFFPYDFLHICSHGAGRRIRTEP